MLALKGNQGTVHQEVKNYLDDAIQRGARELAHLETVEKDHGRQETRGLLAERGVGLVCRSSEV